MRLQPRSTALAAVLLAASGPPPALSASYLCFGDSITEHTGGPAAGYLGPLGAWLARTGPATMFNAGKSGEITDDGLARLKGLLGSGTYDAVLIMEGTNDIYQWARQPQNQNIDHTIANLKAMVQAVQARGARPILATVVPFNGDPIDRDNARTQALNQRIRQIGATIADVEASIAPWVNPYTYDDKVHPSDLGHTLVAEAFAAALSGIPVGQIDLAPPIPTFVDPSPFTTRAPLTADVTIVVAEVKHPFAATTATLAIDSLPVVPTIAATGNEYRYTYAFPADLRFGQVVKVDFRVQDGAAPPNALELAYTFQASPGNGTGADIDFSGRVDGRDLAILAGSFGAARGESRYLFEADVDASGFIDGVDLSFLTAKFGGPP